MDNKMVYQLLQDIKSDVKDIRETQVEQGKELVKHATCMDVMSKELARYNEGLNEHMKRTDILEDLHVDNQKRIEQNEEAIHGKESCDGKGLLKRVQKLEEPGKFNKQLGSKMLKVIGILSAVGGLIAVGLKIAGLY